MRCFRQLLLQPRHWHLSHTPLLISWISYLAIISNVAKGQMQQRSGCEFGAVPSGVRVNPDGPPELFCQMPVCALFPEASTTLQHHPSTSAMPSSKLSEFSTFGTTSSPTAAWMPSSSSTSRQPSKMSSQTPWQMSTASTKKKHHQQQQQMSSSSSGGNPTMQTNPPPMTMMMMGSSQGQQQSQEPQTSTMLTTQQQQQGGRNEAEQMMMATMEMDGINNQMITEGGEGGTTAAADGAAEMMMEEEIRRRRVRRSAMKQPQQQQGTTSAPSVHCSQTLSDVVCDLPNEWTGALNEMNNGTHISLFMQCCTVDGLSQWAAPLKRVVLSQGEQFAGGPVLHNGEMVAFDLIKEIRKNVTTDNQVLYVLSIHRALCLAPVPAVPTPFVASATAPSPYSSASDGPPSPRLSKFSRLYVGARFGPAAAAAGPVGGTLDTARQYLPYSLVRKAVAVQRQREQRLMAINRRRPQKVGQQRQNGMGEMDNDSAVIKPAGMSMINGQQKQPRQRPIYGQRRPYRPWLSQQKQLTEEEDYYEDDGEEGIPIWLLHRRRTPWTKLKRIGSGRRKSKAGSEGNNTIATAVDGQPNGNDKFNRFLSTAVHRYNGGQQQPKGQKNGQHSGKVEVETDEMAVHSTKPRLYANGAGQYAPEQQIPIREPNSDEEFQSIVEQEVGSEIAQEDSQTAAAIVTSEANEEAATVAETAQNYVTLIPQREQQLQQQSAVPVGPFVAPAAPQQPQQTLYPAAVNSPYLPAPPLLPIGERVSPPTAPRGGCGNGGTCPAQAASVVTYTGGGGGCGGGGGGGCGGGGNNGGGCGGGGGGCGGGAPQTVQLACGSCSCSSCQCSSLPQSCSGSSCPTCPSECSCPSECGCAEAAANEAEQEAYRAEYNAWAQQQGQGQSAGQGSSCGSSCTGVGLNGAFAAFQCFTGDQMVTTPRGQVRMDQLKVGDMVLSVDESLVSYSPVVMFLHRRPSERAKFRVIHTEGGHRMKLTDFHLVWAGCSQLKLLRAIDLEPGQCLFALMDQQGKWANGTTKMSPNSEQQQPMMVDGEMRLRLVVTKIKHIQLVEEDGIYAPLTANGNLLVNGVLASCHSNMAAQTLQQTFFRCWRSLHWLYAKWSSTMDWLGTNKLVSSQQQQEKADDDGRLPFGVQFVTSILDMLLPKTMLI